MATHKSVQEFYAYFVDNLKVDKLLTYLRNEKWLTADERETLDSAQMIRRQKVEKLLLLLPRKTTPNFKAEEIFMECTIWSGQEELAKKLGYSDDEITEIRSRNPSATTSVQDAPGHGYADQGSYAGYGSNVGYSNQGYGQPQHSSGVGVQQGGATGYGGASSYSGGTSYNGGSDRRVKVGSSVIIYSQDDDPDDGIQTLAGLLRAGGVDCDVDQYHTTDKIANWDRWWERKVRQIVEENGFILLVISPTLMKCLSNNDRIRMKEGSISCPLLSGMIEERNTTSHIIPVFLDQYIADCMPMSLLQRKCYALELYNLAQFDLENITLKEMESETEFDCLVSLVYKLRGEPEFEKPPVAQIPRIPRPVKARTYTVPVQASVDHSDQVTDKDIPDLISLIRTKNKSWSKLAIRLKVPMKKINEIRSKNLPHDQTCTAMFKLWLAETNNLLTKPELKSLIEGL